MRNEKEAENAVKLYADLVRRICFLHLKNHADTEDIFQNVFLKYILRSDAFESPEHEKAWLIRVTINECKNLLKSFHRTKTIDLDSLSEQAGEWEEKDTKVLEAVLALPPKYKNVIYLFFYEGYTAVEISKILHQNVNTIYTLLSRAKLKLKNRLGGEEFD